MSPKAHPPVVLSRTSFISLGLACTLLSAAFNLGVTWMRIATTERTQGELSNRVTAVETAVVTIRLEEATRLTKLEDGVTTVKEQLAHIDGRLSGVMQPPPKVKVP